MKLKNRIQLITYPDSFGINLKELKEIMDKYFSDYISGIHILPFYPSSGDRGFAPITQLKVETQFGNWNDIKELSKKYLLIADLIANHISAESIFFKDYLKNGEKSKYADYFITNTKFSRTILPHRKKTPPILAFFENLVNKFRNADKIFHSFGVDKFLLKKIYRPRIKSPFVPFIFKDRSVKYLWCTFTKNQIDLDIYNDNIKKLLKTYITKLTYNGIKIIRLDAAGYLIKKRGTSSFMLPETRKVISWLGKVAHNNGALILPEVHDQYDHLIKLSALKNVDYIYDFQLPLLILHSIYNKNFSAVKNWLRIRPNNIISVLDTHDGIPVIDLKNLLSKNELLEISKRIISNGGNEAKKASINNDMQDIDIYQINCTYYSALGENENNYIIARAIQFFIPGIPQIYYVGLLAGKNDIEKLKKTNIGRDVNRHNYSKKEIKQELKRNIVKRLMKLVKFRNNYPIFDGNFSIEESSDKKLILNWYKNKLFLKVKIDLDKSNVKVNFINEKTNQEETVEF